MEEKHERLLSRQRSAECSEKPIEPSTFGGRIRQRRTEMGLTQEDLGKKVGCREQIIDFYERNKMRPETEALKQIALALEIPVSELEMKQLYIVRVERISQGIVPVMATSEENARKAALSGAVPVCWTTDKLNMLWIQKEQK